MPAQVEFRLGSIFDEPCDLIVLPSSAGGTVTPALQRDIRNFGIPFPGAAPVGTVTVCARHIVYGTVTYATTVSGQTSSARAIEQIGHQVGRLAGIHGARKISAPLLGAGAGDLPVAVAAAALTRGFLSTAPHDASLVISVLTFEKLATVTGILSEVVKGAPGSQAIRPKDDWNALLRWWESERDVLTSRRDGPPSATAAPPAPGPLSAAPGPAPVRATTAPAPLAAAPGPAPAHATTAPAPLAAAPGPAPVRATTAPAPLAAAPAPAPSVPAAPASKRKRVFVSYSHEDAEWLERLQKHLRPLEREGALVWADTRIKAGAQWREEIREALAETKVAVLLISADFMASEFIVTNELPPLLKAAEEEGATILPVIISASSFLRTPSLARFQAVNDPEKPLVQLRRGNREKVLDQVARAVEDALNR